MRGTRLFAAAGLVGLIGLVAVAPGASRQQAQAPRIIVYKTPT